MYEILDVFVNWPDLIIVIELHPLDCSKSLCLTFSSVFSFNWIFLKLADKVDMDEISDEFETSQI